VKINLNATAFAEKVYTSCQLPSAEAISSGKILVSEIADFIMSRIPSLE